MKILPSVLFVHYNNIEIQMYYKFICEQHFLS